MCKKCIIHTRELFADCARKSKTAACYSRSGRQRRRPYFARRQESNLLTLGVTNRGALSHRPIYSSVWNLSTSLTNQATSPAQSDISRPLCQLPPCHRLIHRDHGQAVPSSGWHVLARQRASTAPQWGLQCIGKRIRASARIQTAA